MSSKKNANQENTLLQVHKKTAETLGFWDEVYFSTLLRAMERQYLPEIIAQYYIADLIVHGNKVLIKWEKRLRTLTNEELKDIYGTI
jgi:hypothetical protein